MRYVSFCYLLISILNVDVCYSSDLDSLKLAEENIRSSSGSNIACLANGNSTNNERRYVNSLLYKQNNQVKAIIYNRNNTATNPSITQIYPCTRIFGRCAVYSGNIDFFNYDRVCNENNSTLTSSYSSKGKIYSIERLPNDRHLKNLPGTECLIKLARNIKPEDVYVECSQGALIFSSLIDDDFRKVRIEKDGKKLIIERLRIKVETLPLNWLLDYTSTHHIPKLKTAGMTGFVIDSLLIKKTGSSIHCSELATIHDFKNNVKTAHGIFSMENLGNENMPVFWSKAYNDVIHKMLEGDAVYGRVVQFRLFQQPSLFITKFITKNNQGRSKCARFP